jgi:hypothetical protein
MRKSFKYVLFFLLCLAIALAINLPIRQVLPHIKLPPSIRLSGIDGSVFVGKLQEVSVKQFPLRDVRYRFSPSCLLLLKLCYQVEYENGIAFAAYDLLNGDVEVSQARVEYPFAELAKYVPAMFVQPEGRLELFVDELAIVERKPTAVTGKLIWHDLGVPGDGDNATLNIGNYQVDFEGNQQKYDIKISDLDASLDVDGEGDIRAGGQYRLQIKLRSENTIDPKVKSVLELVAEKVSYNNYRLEQNGQLPQGISRRLF